MAYLLHIERDSPIEISEWIAAATARAELRFDESDSTVINPATRSKIVVPGAPGTVAMELEGQLTKVFYWRRGRVDFIAPNSTSAEVSIMRVARQLAVALAAEVRGDEGETY